MTHEKFASHPALEDAYLTGWNAGHGLACHNIPTLGETIWVDGLGRVTVDAENIREVHESLCFEAELNSRQFSPFEMVAHEFNSYGDGDDDTPSADELWDAYNEGVCDAIRADISTYTDEDYGIE